MSSPSGDVLAPLIDLPGVHASADAARAAVDAVLWDRAIRPHMSEVVSESRLRGGWASAVLDGADVSPDSLRSGAALDGSAMGRVVAASLRLQGEVPAIVTLFDRAPLQALARLHAITAIDFVPQDELGRPRGGDSADDPLRLGPLCEAREVPRRLESLARLVTTPTSAPAVILAAVLHAELATVRPFTWGSGLVSRAITRVVLAARGVDPDLATVPETGLLSLGRPAYVVALRAYVSGTPEGVAAWLVFHSEAVALGAEESHRIFQQRASI